MAVHPTSTCSRQNCSYSSEVAGGSLLWTALPHAAWQPSLLTAAQGHCEYLLQHLHLHAGILMLATWLQGDECCITGGCWVPC